MGAAKRANFGEKDGAGQPAMVTVVLGGRMAAKNDPTPGAPPETYRAVTPEEEPPARLCLDCLHAQHGGACAVCGRRCGLRRAARVAGVMGALVAFLFLVATFLWMRSGGGRDLPPAVRFGVGLVLFAVVLCALLARALRRSPHA
jgi:hypothetical protein